MGRQKNKGLLFFLGGARSGKTAAAEAKAIHIAENTGQIPYYLATGQAFDDGMKDRIERHKALRADRFSTIEEPLDLAASIQAIDAVNAVILIDSLGIWLTNMMMAKKDWQTPLTELLNVIAHGDNQVILVSDDVSGGIIPENAMARQFRDELGLINQQVAAAATEVIYVIAGISTLIKGKQSS